MKGLQGGFSRARHPHRGSRPAPCRLSPGARVCPAVTHTTVSRARSGLTLALVFACSHCIQQILEAVLHCHQTGVVHQDLKVSAPCHTAVQPQLCPCRHRATRTRPLTSSPLGTPGPRTSRLVRREQPPELSGPGLLRVLVPRADKHPRRLGEARGALFMPIGLGHWPRAGGRCVSCVTDVSRTARRAGDVHGDISATWAGLRSTSLLPSAKGNVRGNTWFVLSRELLS